MSSPSPREQNLPPLCSQGQGEVGRDLRLLKTQRRHLPKRGQTSENSLNFFPQELQWKPLRERKVCKFLLQGQLKKGPPNVRQHPDRDYLLITLDSPESICQSLSSLHPSQRDLHIPPAQSHHRVFLACHPFRPPAAYPSKFYIPEGS